MDIKKFESEDFNISIQMFHNDKFYGSYATIPPDKQNIEYIRQITSGLAFAAERKIKELLPGTE